MKEKLTVVISAVRKEKIDRDEETFTEFLWRLREMYEEALKTRRIQIQIIEKRGEHA